MLVSRTHWAKSSNNFTIISSAIDFGHIGNCYQNIVYLVLYITMHLIKMFLNLFSSNGQLLLKCILNDSDEQKNRQFHETHSLEYA